MLAHELSLSHFGVMSRAIMMSSLLVPEGTTGRTMASSWTTKSTTTGTSLISIALAIVVSTSSGRVHRGLTQPLASAGSAQRVPDFVNPSLHRAAPFWARPEFYGVQACAG